MCPHPFPTRPSFQCQLQCLYELSGLISDCPTKWAMCDHREGSTHIVSSNNVHCLTTTVNAAVVISLVELRSVNDNTLNPSFRKGKRE